MSPQSGWDTEPFVWRWNQSWSWTFRWGCYPPGRAEFSRPDDLTARTLISDQEPSAEAARARTPPIPRTSPRRARWEIKLLAGYLDDSDCHLKSNAAQQNHHRDGTFAAVLIYGKRFFSGIPAPSLWFCHSFSLSLHGYHMICQFHLYFISSLQKT